MNDLTVVIATYERDAMLRELVDVLRGQTVPVDIIVCDDGSAFPFLFNDIYRDVDRYVWAKRDGGYHRVLRYNEGVALAKTHYVVMLDDDCLPANQNWSASVVERIIGHEVMRGLFLDKGECKLAPWFSSINVCMFTGIAQQVGPFDLNYDGRYGHEDTDLGMEIERRGLDMVIGDSRTAVIHRGDQRHEYHVGLEENGSFFRKKWGVK